MREEVAVSIFDLSGKEVFSTKRKPDGILITLEKEIEALPSGSYLVKVSTESKTSVKKVFKGN